MGFQPPFPQLVTLPDFWTINNVVSFHNIIPSQLSNLPGLFFPVVFHTQPTPELRVAVVQGLLNLVKAWGNPLWQKTVFVEATVPKHEKQARGGFPPQEWLENCVVKFRENPFGSWHKFLNLEFWVVSLTRHLSASLSFYVICKYIHVYFFTYLYTQHL